MNNLRKLLDRKRTAADYIEQTQHRKMNIECIEKDRNAGHIGPAYTHKD